MTSFTSCQAVCPIRVAAVIIAVLFMNFTASALRSKPLGISGRMHLCQQAALIYHEHNGIYPATDEHSTWYEKLVSSQYLPSYWETTHDGSLPIDESGNLFIYELPLGADALISESSKPILRWVGENGIDDQGKGDDIDLRFGVNYGYNYKSGYPYALAIHVIGLLLTFALIRAFFRAVITWKFRFSFLLLWVSVWSGAGGIIGSHGLYGDIAEFSILGVLLGIVSFFACGLGTWITRQRQLDLLRSNVCVVCKYDLRATEGPICPECGRDKTDY